MSDMATMIADLAARCADAEVDLAEAHSTNAKLELRLKEALENFEAAGNELLEARKEIAELKVGSEARETGFWKLFHESAALQARLDRAVKVLTTVDAEVGGAVVIVSGSGHHGLRTTIREHLGLKDVLASFSPAPSAKDDGLGYLRDAIKDRHSAKPAEGL